MNCNLLDLSPYGTGLPLFFFYIRYIIGGGIIFGVLAIICMSMNLAKDNADDWTTDGKGTSVIAPTTVGNYGNEEDSSGIFVQAFLHLIFSVFLMVYLPWWLYRLMRKDFEMDQLTDKPSDYTLMVEGLNCDFEKEELRQHFEEYGLDGDNRCEVKEVIKVYPIRSLVLKRLECLKLEKKLNNPFQKEDIREKIREKLDKLKEELSQEIEQLRRIENGPVAFIILERQIDVRKVALKWKKTPLQKLLSLCKTTENWRIFKGNKIKVERAPEPEDIFWEHLEVSSLQRFFLKIKSKFKVLCILGIYILFYYIKNDYIKSEYLFSANTISGFIIVTITNISIIEAMRKNAIKESYRTRSKSSISIFYSVTTFKLITTALIPLLFANDREKWYLAGGLADQIFNLLVLYLPIALVMLYIIQPTKILKKFKLVYYKIRCYHGLNQLKANELFAPEDFDIPIAHANVIKTIFVGLIYSPMMPISILISGAVLFLTYFLAKWFVLKKARRPTPLNSYIALSATKFLDWGVFLHAIASLFFFRNEPVSFFHFLLVIIYYFIPKKKLLGRNWERKEKDFYSILENNPTYSEMQHKFHKDGLNPYDADNPLPISKLQDYLNSSNKNECIFTAIDNYARKVESNY